MKAALFTVAMASSPSDWQQFNDYKLKYNLGFESQEEDAKRFTIFKANMNRAAELTAKSKSGAKFGASKFAHMTTDEFSKLNGYKPSSTKKVGLKKNYPKNPLKANKDWRGTGAVTPVKDQGQCGSCWAFSATEAIESGYFFSSGEQKILAPQQIVSCDTSDFGCGGGNTGPAYDYVEMAGGIEEESDYPYVSGSTGMNGRCKAHSSEFAVDVTNYYTVAQGASDEDNMVSEIQKTPMSVCVDAESWQLYMGGVVDRSTCGTQLDHCVHLVGLQDGAWIVKNSWASDWGESGFIRVKEGENACGIAEETTYVDADSVSPWKVAEQYV